MFPKKPYLWIHSLWETVSHWSRDYVIKSCIQSMYASCVDTARVHHFCSRSFSQSSSQTSHTPLFNLCGPSACRDISSSSCLIWSVGVSDDCRGPSWRCWWSLSREVLCSKHHVLDQPMPPESDVPYLRKRHDRMLTRTKDTSLLKTLLLDYCKETYWEVYFVCSSLQSYCTSPHSILFWQLSLH